MTALTLFKYVLAVALGWTLAPLLIFATILLVFVVLVLLVAFIQAWREVRRYTRRKK